MEQYKKLKEIADQTGTSVAEVKKNVKRMLQKAKSQNLVFDQDGNLKPHDFDLVEQTAKSVMSGKFTGKDLVRDLQSAAEFFDEKMEKEMRKSQRKEAKKDAKKAKKRAERKARAKAEREERRKRGEIVSEGICIVLRKFEILIPGIIRAKYLCGSE